MKTKLLVLLAFCMVAFAGCYTATIETGRPASNIKIEQNWALCFVYGLVPPKTVETAAKCPHGIAKVMTQISFLNGLVRGLTFGIFSPMTIQVTCARASETSLVDPEETLEISKDASSEAFQNVFMVAAEQVAQSDSEVFVVIEDKKRHEATGEKK